MFSPTHDAGQDGAFQGTWRRQKNEVFEGRFVLQCKFTAKRDTGLSLAMLKDELAKARKLAARGLAQTYLIITNHQISGTADTEIRTAFKAISGLEHFDILGVEWITLTILNSSRLRAFVPRIYGLGDLSQIMNERAYRQAEEILHTWRQHLRKFVPTEAHRRSVKALLDHRFVMLLGEPMAGKSTIAAALSLYASDKGSRVQLIVSPSQFEKAWNPDEPEQFFWVDDVFGDTQFRPTLAAEWSRLFPKLSAAIEGGARVMFTSRTYVFNAALTELKASAFPLLKESKVVIEVEKLSLKEKQRILYNHVRLGTQPQNFRTEIRPFLASIAANPQFVPEIASRLGNPFFTRKLKLAARELAIFVSDPAHVLIDIVKELDDANFAALALLFMRGGKVDVPLEVNAQEELALEQLGVDKARLRKALTALEGDLVSTAVTQGVRYWKYKHPSVRDAMATVIAERHDLVDIYLAGAKPDEIMAEVVCGDKFLQGAKVHIPVARYGALILKLQTISIGDWGTRSLLLYFLNYRCSPDFVALWTQENQKAVEHLFSYGLNHSLRRLLATVHREGALSESLRLKYVERAMRKALHEGDSALLDQNFSHLLTEKEELNARAELKAKLFPNLESKLEEHATDYDTDEEPDDHYDDWKSNLRNWQDIFEEDDEVVDIIRGAEDRLDELVGDLQQKHDEAEAEKQRERDEEAEAADQEEALREELEHMLPSSSKTTNPPAQSDAQERDLFEDIDAPI